MKKQAFLYILPILFFSSCDAYLVLDGRVLSHNTKQPIEGAIVELVDEHDTVKTDKNGYFRIEKISGFKINPVIRVVINNYKPFEIAIKTSGNDKTYKVNSSFVNIDYKKPVYRNSNSFIVGTSVKKYSESFTIDNDTLLLYLDTINLDAEIERSKNQFTNPK